MSADQGRTTSQVPVEPIRCVCSDLDILHDLNAKNERTRCSSSLCDCTRFIAEGGAS